jgi:CDP-glucose 4,6-dehydratase
LGWRPRLPVGEALSWTADWYRAHAAGENMTSYSEAQIARYESLPAVRS